MDALAAAQASAPAISTITSHFMLAGTTYKRGAELGFEGLDFYVTGRGGVLGDVDAGVVAAAFVVFEPANVRTQWEKGTAVMSPRDAARAFAACAADWAAAHVPDDLDAARLALLAQQVATSARVAGAPVLAGWRTLDAPTDPAGAAVHHLNALRELRFGLHAACLLGAGLSPVEAVAVKSPGMAPIYGWSELPPVDDALHERWAQAEANTDRAIAHAFEPLTEVERAELVELAGALHAATSA
ncbi:SCO6745 family protein [Actinomarinicola tropica]|uniref:EvbL n=1 Tax=Actinomarinicola tropica TaxID=2789776 RepID=A0A5Q2RDP7_9ACTN|nr:hypothetical protein [Actinomarinicola tropica]QGG95008.1 hypothetical protein GH723_07760 [Actinomarinicola tropica]